MPLVRIAKYISECGVASRRKAEELIEMRKVKVNSRIITEPGTKIDPTKDQVRVRNRIIQPPPKGVLLFNKPRGVISTLDDPQGRRTIAHFLTKHYTSYFPAGRLDWDSTGLMVLTNDGELAACLTHPRYGMQRVYHVRVAGHPCDKTFRRLGRGIRLEDGMASAKVRQMRDDAKSAWLEVTIGVGRKRVVRRMLEKVGHRVLKLKRVEHGPFKLGRLPVGELRRLSEKQYESFRKTVLQQSKGDA